MYFYVKDHLQYSENLEKWIRAPIIL